MLSLKDLEGREMKEDLNPFNVLLEVAAVALEKLEKEKRLEREKDQSNSGFRDNLVSSPKQPRSIRYVSPLSANLSERKRGWFSHETPPGFLRREFLVQEGKSVKVDGPGMIRENPADFVGKNSMRTHVAYCSNMSPVVRENSSQKDGGSGEGVMDNTKLERLTREKLLKRPVAVDEDVENEMSFNKSEEHDLNLWSDPTPDMLMNEWLVGDKLFGKEFAYPEFDKAKQDSLTREKLLNMCVETESSLNNEEKKGRKRSFEAVDRAQHVLKFKKKKSLKNETAEPHDLPQEFGQRIMELEGTNVVLVLQKKLYNTDVSKGQTRFSIPRNQVKNKFLTEDEERIIHTHDGKKWMAIEVLLIQPDLQESRLDLKMWNMKKVSGRSSSSYVIVGGWYSVVKSNQLKVGDLVQLWAFRRGTELSFALVVVQRAEVEDGNNSSNAHAESHKSEDH